VAIRGHQTCLFQYQLKMHMQLPVCISEILQVFCKDKPPVFCAKFGHVSLGQNCQSLKNEDPGLIISVIAFTVYMTTMSQTTLL